MKKLSLGNALFITFFVTLALLGIQFAGLRLAGLPFSPFDLYEALTRSGMSVWQALVEGTMTFFANNGRNTAQALTLTRWLWSLAAFALLALLAGVLVWTILGRRPTLPDALDGVTVGMAWGLPMMILAIFAGRSLVDPVLIIVWILGLYAAWGIVHAMAYRKLMQPLTADAPAQESSDEDVELVTSQLDAATAARIDRRRFLFQLGASTAAITAVSASAGALLGADHPDPRLRPPFPVADAALQATHERLLTNFRRFAIVRFPPDNPADLSVVALGAEYPDRHYVTVWIGDGSPIVVYESLETVLAAYNTDNELSDLLWLDT